MHTITSTESSLHFDYTSSAQPLVHVKAGEQISFQTLDTRSGALLDRTPGLPYRLPLPTPGAGNPVTGPAAVEGAVPGSTLVVDIDRIKVGPVGWCGGHAHVGPTRPGFVTEPVGRTCRVDSGMIHFSDDIVIPADPMLGCIGTAPAEPVSTSLAGRHGGNMDQAIVGEGARVLLPVFAPGGLLFVGDVHANQGDGELSGVALEIPAQVDVTLGVNAELSLSWPWVMTPNVIAVLTAESTFEEARAEAVENMVRAVQARHGLASADCLALLSISGHLRIGQAYGGEQLTVRLEMPADLDLQPVS